MTPAEQYEIARSAGMDRRWRDKLQKAEAAKDAAWRAATVANIMDDSEGVESALWGFRAACAACAEAEMMIEKYS